MMVVNHGAPCLVRCLLQLRKVLYASDLYYLGVKIYVDPYLAWLQNQAQNDLVLTVQRWAEMISQTLSTATLIEDVGLGPLREYESMVISEEYQDGNDGQSSDSNSTDEDNDSESSASSNIVRCGNDSMTGEKPNSSPAIENSCTREGHVSSSSELLDFDVGKTFSLLKIVDGSEAPSEAAKPEKQMRVQLIQDLTSDRDFVIEEVE